MSDTIKNYLGRLTQALNASDSGLLLDISKKIVGTKKSGARIFTCGNGGSAATASHFCNDLIKGCRIDNRMGFKAMALNDPTPVVTCLANDYGYDEIFKVQLQTHAKAGDLLIAFSGSGNSPNVIKAIETARQMGVFVIGFGGRDGGKMKPLCDVCMVAPTWSMEELEDLHLCYCHAMIACIREELADTWDIEVVNYPKQGGYKYALFDFDGTLSLLREGWQDIMVPYFTEVMREVSPKEDVAAIKEIVREFVDTLTGKQTIFQCERLAEEVQKRGGTALEPLAYKAEYLRRLFEEIKGRHEILKKDSNLANDYLVPGAKAFLEGLKNKGVRLYLASGTDETDVLAEAELLGVARYFDGGIYGAKDSIKDCSKEIVIKKILDENNISGQDLISFGDGYVEVQLVKDIKGYAVALATDEKRRKGVDAWKRKRLLSADADAVIPDFCEADKLINFIMGE